MRARNKKKKLRLRVRIRSASDTRCYIAPPTMHAFWSRAEWEEDSQAVEDSTMASQLVSCEWLKEQLDKKTPNLKILDGK